MSTSVIATNFSVVSVPFVFLTAQIAGIAELSGTLYISMVVVGVVCALITPRLPREVLTVIRAGRPN